MPLVVAVVLVFVLLGFVFASFARDRGPRPADVAVAYELASDRLDYDTVFDLSGAELRDGLRRDQYVAARRGAHGDTGGSLARAVHVRSVEQAGDVARVGTEVVLDDGVVRNDVLLERRGGAWMVVRYALHRDDAAGGDAAQAAS